MTISPVKFEPTAVDVVIEDSSLVVTLADGREISVPLEWFPLLRNASAAERSDWRLIGGGIGIHWPAVDEDISVESILRLR